MEKSQEREKIKEQFKTQEVQKEKSIGTTANYCPKCGTINSNAAKFCEECGTSLAVSENCTLCNTPILSGADICEHCGCLLNKTECSFCGFSISKDDMFCGDCGVSTRGITCSSCSTLSFSDFCPSCNKPLTDRAKAELEALKNDKPFQEVLSLWHELQAFEKEAERIIEEEIQKAQNAHLEAESQAIENKKEEDPDLIAYRQKIKEALQEMGQEKKAEPLPTPSPKPHTPKPDVSFSDAMMEALKKTKQKEIEAKRKEIQDKMDKICEKNFPIPQISRNFYAARKLPDSNMVWKCFFTGDVHPNPQNCGKPQLGGKWIIEFNPIYWVTHDGSR